MRTQHVVRDGVWSGREVRLRGRNQLIRRFEHEFRFQERFPRRRARHDRALPAAAAGIVSGVVPEATTLPDQSRIVCVNVPASAVGARLRTVATNAR